MPFQCLPRVVNIKESVKHPDDYKTSTYQPVLTISLAKDRRAQNYCSCAAICVAGTCSLIIKAYGDASSVSQHDVNEHHTEMASGIQSLPLLGMLDHPFESQSPSWRRVPSFFQDPSPIHLVAACLGYSIAMHGFYLLHRGDKYQLGIVVCGALSALAVGRVLGEDVHSVLTGLVSWFIMASLVLSAVLHRVM